MSETATPTDDFDVDPTARYIGFDGHVTAAGYDAGRHLDELHPTIDWATAAADLEVHVQVARRLHDAHRRRAVHHDDSTQHGLF